MYMLLGLLGLLAAAVFLILIVVSLFTQNGMKRNLIGFFMCSILFFVCVFASTEKEEQPQTTEKSSTAEPNGESGAKNPEDTYEIIEPNQTLDTGGYMYIDADVLFEYNGYLSGENVVTVITVSDIDESSKMLKAKTENNDSLFFSITCKFLDESEMESVKEGDILTVAGMLEEKSEIVETITFLETPTASLEGCTIIGRGEIAEDLKAASAEQIQICEEAKQDYEKQIQEEREENRNDYISQCETVKYSSVERNPSEYDGKKIKVSGKVIQVSEGWFDSVTLRVESGGNVWLVTYYRGEGESRILENDSLTCYGECTGVTNYKTVLGNTKTIPSMKMEYYD